ncbi:Arginase/deacetylase [Mycena floridula]|nr:Arginase/deacetylase [Mycena floridula]
MAPTAILIQDVCYHHQYIRTKDNSHIFERPERLRAVKVGLAAAIARLDEASLSAKTTAVTSTEDELADALGRIKLNKEDDSVVSVIHSSASIDMLQNQAVKFIHGDIDRDVYLENLKQWASDSLDKIAKGESEIPQGLPQNDLYLCPESITAMQGAMGTVCEAVDLVVKGETKRTFAAIRPPGHHCGEDTPGGFCFVNNVAVAAAHAHLNHNINRIVMFDIDLHHGNGTQSIVWQINEESYRRTLESESQGSSDKPALKVYYGSIHDILSFPCEDGKVDLIQAASTSIHGAHGQYIENIHLQTYDSEAHFWDALYTNRYSLIFRKAEDFIRETGGPGDDVLVLISCGMDACEHEYESMSRHNRKVPTSFFYRFTQDACKFSDRFAGGKIVSVLEGGYSDRALASGAMAHLVGLAGNPDTVDEKWWDLENLVKIEKATKKRKGGKQSLGGTDDAAWLERTAAIFASLEPDSTPIPRPVVPQIAMKLRERKKPSPAVSPAGKKGGVKKERDIPAGQESAGDDSEQKKLPRVILKLGPRPDDPDSV